MNTKSLWKEVHGCQWSLALEGFVCELQSWGRGITRMERAERWRSLFTNLKRGHQCAHTSLPSYPQPRELDCPDVQNIWIISRWTL